MQYALYYFCFISLVAVIVTVHDKSAAIKGNWRVPEKTLFIISLLGGSAAMYLTMLTVRHKTLHKRFMIGIPAIIVLQVIIICLIIRFLVT